MKEAKAYSLKPISKEDFEKLSPRRTNYVEIVDEFLRGNDEIVEIVMPNKKVNTIYGGLKAFMQRKNYPFLLRKREGRIFLLKRTEVKK